MTIYGIQGRPRSGKTLLGVRITERFYRQNYYVVSNVPIDLTKSIAYHMTRQSQSHILSIKDIEKAINNNLTLNELYNADKIVIYISEMMQYANARRATSNTNLLVEYMLSQLGKTNTTFIWDAQLNHTVDITLRELTEYLISAYKLLYTTEFEGKLYPNTIFGFKYLIEDKLKPPETKPYTFLLRAKAALPTFDLYYTSKVYKADTLKLKISEVNEPGKESTHYKF